MVANVRPTRDIHKQNHAVVDLVAHAAEVYVTSIKSCKPELASGYLTAGTKTNCQLRSVGLTTGVFDCRNISAAKTSE